MVNRKSRLAIGITLAVLSYLFAGAQALAGTTYVVHVDVPGQWQSNLGILATANGTTVRITDEIVGGAGTTVALDYRQQALIEHFAGNLRAGSPAIGVAALPVTSGAADIYTEATFTDPSGVANVVRIPALPGPIAASTYPSQTGWRRVYLDFPRIENTHLGNYGKRTDLALFSWPPDSSVRAEITTLDETGATVGTQTVDVTGYAFVRLLPVVRYGRVIIQHHPLVVGGGGYTTGSLFAVAFSGLGVGGPDVIIPDVYAVTVMP